MACCEGPHHLEAQHGRLLLGRQRLNLLLHLAALPAQAGRPLAQGRPARPHLRQPRVVQHAAEWLWPARRLSLAAAAHQPAARGTQPTLPAGCLQTALAMTAQAAAADQAALVAQRGGTQSALSCGLLPLPGGVGVDSAGCSQGQQKRGTRLTLPSGCLRTAWARTAQAAAHPAQRVWPGTCPQEVPRCRRQTQRPDQTRLPAGSRLHGGPTSQCCHRCRPGLRQWDAVACRPPAGWQLSQEA